MDRDLLWIPPLLDIAPVGIFVQSIDKKWPVDYVQKFVFYGVQRNKKIQIPPLLDTPVWICRLDICNALRDGDNPIYTSSLKASVPTYSISTTTPSMGGMFHAGSLFSGKILCCILVLTDDLPLEP
jgi:hypothetical protein